MLSFAALVVASSMVVGQAPTPNGLQAMEPFLGTWEFKGTFPDDLSPEVKKGDPFVGIGTYAWARNKSAVTIHVTTAVNGKKIEWTDGVMVWDPAAKVIRGLDSYYDGGIADYTIRIDGSTLVYQIKGVTSDGTPTSATITDVLENKDTIKSVWTNRKQGDRALEDWPLTGRRVNKSSATPVAQATESNDHLRDLDYFVGDWAMEGEIKVEGEFTGLDELTKNPLRMQMTYEWFGGQTFLLLTIREKAGAAPMYVAVMGWDPESKQIRSTDFNSQGARLKYVHVKKDKVWIAEGPSIYPDGAEGKYRGENTIIDHNTFRHTGRGTIRQNGKESKVTLTYEAKRK